MSDSLSSEELIHVVYRRLAFLLEMDDIEEMKNNIVLLRKEIREAVNPERSA